MGQSGKFLVTNEGRFDLSTNMWDDQLFSDILVRDNPIDTEKAMGISRSLRAEILRMEFQTITMSFIEKMIEADGIILGSPTYFADTATNIKALIERAGYATGGKLKHKVGAAVVAVRRAGATHVFSSINYFFLIKQMFVVGSSYWNLGVGKQPGDVLKDEEGIQTFKNLGQNFAFLLKKIHQ